MSRYEVRWDSSDGRNSWSETTLGVCTSVEAAMGVVRLHFGAPPYPYQLRIVKFSSDPSQWSTEVKLPKGGPVSAVDVNGERVKFYGDGHDASRYYGFLRGKADFNDE